MTTLLDFLKTNVIGFINRRDNPNQVTADQAGGYTKEATDNLLKGKIPVGILPIYAYGTSDGSSVPCDYNGFVLTFLIEQPLLIYGTPYTISNQGLDLHQYPNSTVYITAELVGGIPVYKAYAAKPTDTNTCINIGTASTNATGITGISITKVRGVIPAPAPTLR